jgi:O-antigen ligase
MIRLTAALLLAGPLLSLQKSLIMAPLLSLLAACLLFGPAWRPSRRSLLTSALAEQRSFLAILAAVLLWALASCFWSFDTLFSLRSWAMLAGTTLGGWLTVVLFARLPAERQGYLANALAIGLAMAGLILLTIGLLERVGRFDFGLLLWKMDPVATIVALLVWPTLAWLSRVGRARAGLGLLLVSLLGIVVAHDLAAKVAILAAGLAWLGGRWAPTITVRAIAAAAVAACLLTPLAALWIPPPQASAEWGWLPSSAHHRLTIWSFTARHIAEKPLFGWGLDSARAIPGGKTQIPVVRLKGCAQTGEPVALPGIPEAVAGDCIAWEESLPLHPHDGWLQIWLELGGVGALLVAPLLWQAIGRPRCPAGTAAGQAATAATLAAGLIIASVSFGVWQSWWLSTLWLAAALVVPLRKPPNASAHDLGNPASLV